MRSTKRNERKKDVINSKEKERRKRIRRTSKKEKRRTRPDSFECLLIYPFVMFVAAKWKLYGRSRKKRERWCGGGGARRAYKLLRSRRDQTAFWLPSVPDSPNTHSRTQTSSKASRKRSAYIRGRRRRSRRGRGFLLFFFFRQSRRRRSLRRDIQRAGIEDGVKRGIREDTRGN